jgi:hypothetical protein
MAMLQAQADTLENQLAVPAPAVPQNGDGAIRPAMQRTMALIEEAEVPTVRETRKKRKGSGIKRYWAQFTSEERSEMMKRRARVTRRRRKAAGL